MEYLDLFAKLERILMEINYSKTHPKYSKELKHMFDRLRISRDRIAHGDFDRRSFISLYIDIKEFTFIFDNMIHTDDVAPNLSMRIREFTNRLEYFGQRLGMN